MEDLERSRLRWSARILAGLFLSWATLCPAESVAIRPQWLVDFPPAANGKPSQATAVPVKGGSILVSVVGPGSDAGNATAQLGGSTVAVKSIGYDPVTRLGFFKTSGELSPKEVEWIDEATITIGSKMGAMTGRGMVNCRITGWVKQVGGKILPLALLQCEFEQVVPPAGTPLLDGSGRVVALVFQAAGTGNTAYAIPAEAVHRVWRDVCNGGRLAKGWLGLSLMAENRSPKIVRVLPNSPASAVGIKPSDVLVRVGTRKISEYADAANAFFYLIPGEAVQVKLLRAGVHHEFTMTPIKSPTG